MEICDWPRVTQLLGTSVHLFINSTNVDRASATSSDVDTGNGVRNERDGVPAVTEHML